MPFNPGKEKTGGRKVGTPNRTTSTIKERIAQLVDEKFDSIIDDLEKLDPQERVTVYLRLLEYVIPKQRETRIDLSTLSDEEIDTILEKALTKMEENENESE
ncbi:hypothetical protein LX87_03163 [Larkinella arboricola]|uniref:Uncharacterized protein n=1 Tax=Larkinella arboricola TaxID=643671 RepID=A0A327WS29_LARAB|nr:hypothetical protein [Larkinella arboricola]RAJ95418.1 hypothetical protein LX87_03163 [Larkinella arboricola]